VVFEPRCLFEQERFEAFAPDLSALDRRSHRGVAHDRQIASEQRAVEARQRQLLFPANVLMTTAENADVSPKTDALLFSPLREAVARTDSHWHSNSALAPAPAPIPVATN
jgi:hypothetical protein